jgi:hypothetical protein
MWRKNHNLGPDSGGFRYRDHYLVIMQDSRALVNFFVRLYVLDTELLPLRTLHV